jgi:hypothetical protein
MALLRSFFNERGGVTIDMALLKELSLAAEVRIELFAKLATLIADV